MDLGELDAELRQYIDRLQNSRDDRDLLDQARVAERVLQTATNYLRVVRMRAARRMLVDHDLEVVAESSGFSVEELRTIIESAALRASRGSTPVDVTRRSTEAPDQPDGE